MNLSPTAQAILLLTCYFSKSSDLMIKPLNNVEWAKFTSWLKDNMMTPADLLVDPQSKLHGWHDRQITLERILGLLGRGYSLALAIEKWQRAGLWVITRSDPEYPRRLKQRLRADSPPVLFGCGNKALLNVGGLAVVGSRDAGDADLVFTDQVGTKAATEGIAVVSGGARGVDETAMLGAMKQGGVVIGVMADSLLKAATSAKWRNGLMDGHVVLVSPFYPEAGFNAGNAMARNKYIYCLADASLVIHSGKKGGTITGAEENIKKEWVPLWVKPTTDKDAANAYLVAKGGYWCQADSHSLTIADLLTNSSRVTAQIKKEQIGLFSTPAQSDLFTEIEPKSEVEIYKAEQNVSGFEAQTESVGLVEHVIDVKEPPSSSVNFYGLFTTELQRLAELPVTVDELIKKTGLHKSQLTDWLKRAEEDGVVKKLNRPARYQIEKNQ